MAGNSRSGRKRVPIEVHLARGTYRPDRHGPLPRALAEQEAKASGEEIFFTPDRYENDKKAAEDFTLYMELLGDAVKPSDSMALTMLVDTWRLINRSIEELADKPTDKAARAAYFAYSQLFLQLSARLGLTPADRATLERQLPQVAPPSVSKRLRG